MLWKPTKVMKIYENQWNGSQLESSKCFFRGRTSMPQGATGLQTSDPWNPWNAMKTNENHENQWNSNQLESSKGYFRGKTSMPHGATGLQTSDPWNPWNLMKCYESLWKSCKSIKINEIATSWNRAKVSWGAGPRCHNAPQGSKPRTLGIHEISWNAMKTFENHKNLMK